MQSVNTSRGRCNILFGEMKEGAITQPRVLQFNLDNINRFMHANILTAKNPGNVPARVSNSQAFAWRADAHTIGLRWNTREIASWVYELPLPLRLTAHNWQKWKRVGLFLTCPCHEIYRDEAVGRKSCKYTWKITIYVNMWNLGQFHVKLIFCQ